MIPTARRVRLGILRRLMWSIRLSVHRHYRIQILLPLFASTRSGKWRDFRKEPWLHDETAAQIKTYLGARAGITFEFLRRDRSSGEWEGGPREKNAVFYIDVDLRVADIEWFLKKSETEWRDRFDQHEIYLVFHKIWKEKSRAS